jgi:protoheme IX farnesyltransferase
MGFASPIYGAASILGGAAMLACAIRVFLVRRGAVADRAAMQLFGISILYLFVLFAIIVAERGVAAVAATSWAS